MRNAMSIEERNYEVENDLRTIVRANEIRKDKKRMARVKALAKKQLQAAQQKNTDLEK